MEYRDTVLLVCPKHGVVRETDQDAPKFSFLGPICRENIAVQGYASCHRILLRRDGKVATGA